MKAAKNLLSLTNNQDSLVAAILGFFLIQIFSKHSGIGISPDSVTYLSAARNMVNGNGFISYENLPVVDFPFFYPFFLTIISFITGLDPLQFGCLLNGILFAILLYGCGAIMNGFNETSRWYKRIILCCIFFSPALQEVYSMLWSETVFLLLILLCIVGFSAYLRKPGLKQLLLAALVCAVACLTRYAGIFLILTGVFLIFFNGGMSWRSRLEHSLIFGSISSSLFMINIVRNFVRTGLAMGQRPKSLTGFVKIMEYFGGGFCDWLLIGRGTLLTLTLAVLVLLVFPITMYFTSRRPLTGYRFEYVIAVTGLMYCLFMLFTSMLTRYEQFTSRLLSPLFIPLLWSLSWWVPVCSGKKTGVSKWIFGSSFLLIAAWFINKQLAADYEYYDGVKDAGIPGYREDPFLQSDIVQYVGKNRNIFRDGLPIYSNAGDAVYMITGLPARQLPFKAYPLKVQQYYQTKNEFLVWFRDLDNPEMPALDTILRNKHLVLLKELPDGAVYVSR